MHRPTRLNVVAIGLMVSTLILLPGVAGASKAIASASVTYTHTSNGETVTETAAWGPGGELLLKFGASTYFVLSATKFEDCGPSVTDIQQLLPATPSDLSALPRVCLQFPRSSKQAKALFEIFTLSYRSPLSKGSLLSSLLSGTHPSGTRTVARVISNCETGNDLGDTTTLDTLCTAKAGGFLTLFTGSSETDTLRRYIANPPQSAFAQPPHTRLYSVSQSEALVPHWNS